MRSHQEHLVRGLTCPNFQRLLWCRGIGKQGASEKPAVVAPKERDACGGLDKGGTPGDRSNKVVCKGWVTLTARVSWVWGKGEEPRTAPKVFPLVFFWLEQLGAIYSNGKD